MQGWRTHQADGHTCKIDAYKWLNPDKDGTDKSNHINSPIGWQLLGINQLENHVNAHSSISTLKMKTMAEQITTKELIYRINQMRRMIVEHAYKSLDSNHY